MEGSRLDKARQADSPLHADYNLALVELLSVSVNVDARLCDFKVGVGGDCLEQRGCGWSTGQHVGEGSNKRHDIEDPPAASATAPLSNLMLAVGVLASCFRC